MIVFCIVTDCIIVHSEKYMDVLVDPYTSEIDIICLLGLSIYWENMKQNFSVLYSIKP